MAYTDLTSEFDYKDLLTYQNMDKLAANDAFVHLPSGTVMAFYQSSAPTGWIKQTDFDDGCLRVTSGAGAGSGGSLGISSGLTLAHTHTVTSHTHTLAHSHQLDYDVNATGFNNNVDTSRPFMSASDSDGSDMFMGSTAVSATVRRVHNENSRTTTPTSGGSTPATNSQLSNITFAYIDVIVCAKD